MYLTYDQYVNMGGTVLEETAFQQLEFEARGIIDWWTFNRLQNEEEYPEAVQRCMYRLIYLIQERNKSLAVDPQTSDGGVQAGIVSESNDGVSTSYNTLAAGEAVTTLQKEVETAIKMYLTGVRNSLGHRLLYRGVYPNE